MRQGDRVKILNTRNVRGPSLNEKLEGRKGTISRIWRPGEDVMGTVIQLDEPIDVEGAEAINLIDCYSDEIVLISLLEERMERVLENEKRR